MMKYLFFDSESIHIKHEYSYTFGYVLTDENFNVLRKEDIVFNPNLKKEEYDWRVVRTMMEPSYSLKDINKKEMFPKFYTKIKRLIMEPNTLCIGFQMDEDVKYLLNNCLRHKLKPINFKYIDIRDVIKILTKTKSEGLAKEYFKWCHKIPELAHTSDIDAMMTCEVLKNVLKKYNTSLPEFLQNYSEVICECKDFSYVRKQELKDILTPQTSNNKINGIRLKRLTNENVDWIVKHSINERLFLRYLDSVEIKTNTGHILEGKKVSISLNYELYNYKNMVKIISLLANAGANYSKKASEADVLVTYDEVLDELGNIRSCTKLKYVKEANSQGAEIAIIDFDKFLSLFNMDREKLNEMADIDLEYLKDKKYSKR